MKRKILYIFLILLMYFEIFLQLFQFFNKIYNILNRIQMLEHRLSTLDTYAEVSQGEKYGQLLQERLSYNKELMNQYEFLVGEQKQFTNGYKDFINSVEGLEGVFDFDKYGQIIINWEKYINLQDQAADGEVTLKQKADDVYNTYTEMFKELQDDFDKYIAYLKKAIDLQQEMVDKYVDMENKAANAVKEIYQKILDTKLEAIDKEKEAIEDLRRAREEARKDQENAKTVSGLQTNLQRAMMDTSGASDVAFLKAQQDLDDKLEDIAEDKYSKMLDDITDKLGEEQEALRKTSNVVTLEGYICKKPIYRQTPFGREISDILLAVNRAYNKSDYIPSIAWGRNARFSQSLPTGAEVRIVGRVQSRNYEKRHEDGTIENRVAYEVSIASLEVISQDNEFIKKEETEESTSEEAV